MRLVEVYICAPQQIFDETAPLIPRCIHPFIWIHFTYANYLVIFGIRADSMAHIGVLLQRGRKEISATLTLLWVVVMLTFAMDWWYHRSAFVDHDNSADEIVAYLLRITPPTRVDQAIFTADNMFSVSSNWLADAILVRRDKPTQKHLVTVNQIWRCFILWDNKRWMLLPLPVLFIANIGNLRIQALKYRLTTCYSHSLCAIPLPQYFQQPSTWKHTAHNIFCDFHCHHSHWHVSNHSTYSRGQSG